MKKILCLLLASLLAGTSVLSQSSQESPELAEATELTKSVAKLYKENKFDDALPLARHALEIRERLLPPTDPRVTMSLGYLGDVYMAKKNYDNARKTFERLLLIQEERFGPEVVKFAYVLDRLAALYYEDRKYAKAEELYRRALEAREKAFGPESVQVAETLYAMGQFYRFRMEYDRAFDAYKRSLMIYGRSKGVTTLEFQRASNGFACVGYESGKETMLQEVGEIQKWLAPDLPVAPPTEIVNGRALVLAKPDYPREARAMNLQGTVVVQVEIDENGKVTSAKDLCQGLPYLGESCIKAAFRSRFSPTKLSGVPVKVKGVIRYNFIWR